MYLGSVKDVFAYVLMRGLTPGNSLISGETKINDTLFIDIKFDWINIVKVSNSGRHSPHFVQRLYH